jgi:hypothetical protein
MQQMFRGVMRIRIVRAPTMDSVDGIHLDGYQVGSDYDVGTVLASLFIAEGWAVPTDEATVPASRDARHVWGSGHEPRAIAADRRGRRR